MAVARLLFAATILTLPACGEKKDKDTGPVDDTGWETHPFVPEEYVWIWDTDGCEVDGDPGASVYHLATGSSTGTGSLQVTETWYWFFGNEGYEGDCYDSFTFEADPSDIQFSDDYEPCSECELEYSGKYTNDESSEYACNISYSSFFDSPEGLYGDYELTLWFDPLTPAGNPNEDNKMLVIAGWWDDNSIGLDMNYALGHAFPENDGDYDANVALDWVSDQVCVKVN